MATTKVDSRRGGERQAAGFEDASMGMGRWDDGASHRAEVIWWKEPAGPQRSHSGKYFCNLGCGQSVPINEQASHELAHSLQDPRSMVGVTRSPEVVQTKQLVRADSGRDRLVSKAVGKAGEKEENSEINLLTRNQIIGEFNPMLKEGLMPLLRQAVEEEINQEEHSIFQVALAGHVDHYESKKKDDLGWGCGWRNIQMLCSHLIRMREDAKRVLFGGVGFVPSIKDLQQWLERAWRSGFDMMGAEQLGWKVHGTNKWIGTTECAALLRSFGLRARIVDFKYTGNGSPTAGAYASPTAGAATQEQELHCVELRPRRKTGGREREWNINLLNDLRPSAKHRRWGSWKEMFLVHKDAEQPWDNDGFDAFELARALSMSLSEHAQTTPAVHTGVYCDGCAMNPLKGPRFKSMKQKNFDLCLGCWEKVDEVRDRKLGCSRDYMRIERPEVKQRETTAAISSPRVKSTAQNREKVSQLSQASSQVLNGWDLVSGDDPIHMALVEWVWQYFTEGKDGSGKGTTIIDSKRKPGHVHDWLPASRILLTNKPSDELSSCLRHRRGWQRLVKRPVQSLRKAEYQVCYVEPGIASREEWEQLKELDSILQLY
ncbi:hypothetical protein CBR_g29958 [Chara braunii]|nr:hypothetical protein CBR_g29958 [Chara braunii]|eukprot:GBG79693.1 hypothetical protein CBR_g29958 [Chara braunii]